ncbi:hypothetical protein VNO78_33901 [Psophocarpus tetragonolobus]|uniref:Uncharacterized protein n=1 Tax=Psophocarpus tetragonolobus TaxID=3891 RepID=A0AAN9P348_PSOTE
MGSNVSKKIHASSHASSHASDGFFRVKNLPKWRTAVEKRGKRSRLVWMPYKFVVFFWFLFLFWWKKTLLGGVLNVFKLDSRMVRVQKLASAFAVRPHPIFVFRIWGLIIDILQISIVSSWCQCSLFGLFITQRKKGPLSAPYDMKL